jgi:type I restriction enzyme S subunit
MIQEKKISDFAEVITGGTPSTTKNEYWEGGDIPWLNSGELNKKYIYESKNFITELGLKNSSTRLMPPDTVLIALTGATCGLSALSKLEACANQSVTGILPSKSHIPEYLFHFLRTQRQRILDKAWGNAQPHISQAFVKDFVVPLPSISDQLHIANLLGKAENLIAQRKENISLLDEFLKSTFLEMFGDPGINPKKWPVKKLEEYIEYMGDIGSNGSNEMVAKNLEMLDVEDYAIMIRTTNLTRNDFTNNIKYVTQKTYDFFKKSKIYGGEIIMNKIGSAGDFWLMPKLNLPVTLGLNQLVIRPKNLPTLYLFHYLSTDYGRMIVKAQAKGATTKSITKTAVKALPLMSPPVELQNKFVAIVEKTEAIKTQYQQSLQELENLYGSLSKKAFRGELSIKDESLLMAAEPQAEYNKK